jgi:hypothetical protein
MIEVCGASVVVLPDAGKRSIDRQAVPATP